MFKGDHLSKEEFLGKLKMLKPESKSGAGIEELLECIGDLQQTERKIDKALSKKRTEIQEYLTFCPQDIYTTLRIYINTEWQATPQNDAKKLNFLIFGQFLLNDKECQLESVSDQVQKFKFLRINNFVDLVRELRIDFINSVGP